MAYLDLFGQQPTVEQFAQLVKNDLERYGVYPSVRYDPASSCLSPDVDRSPVRRLSRNPDPNGVGLVVRDYTPPEVKIDLSHGHLEYCRSPKLERPRVLRSLVASLRANANDAQAHGARLEVIDSGLTQTTWTQGYRESLPRADLLVLQLVGPCYSPADIVTVAWERAVAIIGNLMTPQGIYPERYLVDQFPGEDQLEALITGPDVDLCCAIARTEALASWEAAHAEALAHPQPKLDQQSRLTATH